jgi:hypothetical protein
MRVADLTVPIGGTPTVANLVPYDFRIPTLGRVRNTYWNPNGPVFSGEGVGRPTSEC